MALETQTCNDVFRYLQCGASSSAGFAYPPCALHAVSAYTDEERLHVSRILATSFSYVSLHSSSPYPAGPTLVLLRSSSVKSAYSLVRSVHKKHYNRCFQFKLPCQSHQGICPTGLAGACYSRAATHWMQNRLVMASGLCGD